MKRILSFLIVIIVPAVFYAQEGADVVSFSVEEIYEQLAAEADDDIDLTVLLEDLYYFAENPINLNKATRSRLQKLPFLNETQIQGILDYPALNGPFLSIYELGLIPGIDIITIQRLLPFVTLSETKEPEKISFPSIIHYGKHELMLRYQQVLEDQEGYKPLSDSLLELSPNSRYLGSPGKFYTRYKFRYSDNISVGFTGEKDAGEEFFKGTQKQGFDFNSAHFFYQNNGIIKQIAVGDFHAQFGQGLILWSGYSFGKSLENITLAERINQGIRPYTSTDENNFFRGVATTIGWDKLKLTTFYSTKYIDGNKIITDTINNEEQFYISAFQETGIHATRGEILDRHSVKEDVIGASLQFASNKSKLALNYAYARYNTNLHRNIQPYNQFYFQGDELSNLSLSYRFKLWRLNLFGETALNDSLIFAGINGFSVNIGSSASLVIINRFYPARFYAIKSNSFGEKQNTQNENGTYIAFEFSPASSMKLTCWFDTYRFPWLRYGVDAPSKGYEYAMQVNYFHNQTFQIYSRYRFELSEQSPNNDYASTSGLESFEKQNIRLHIQYQFTDAVRFKNRIEYTQVSSPEGRDDGWLMYQDISYSFSEIALKLYARYAIFDTNNWNSRVYAYENDVLYAFSVPAMYSKGSRTYFMLKYSLGRNIDAWARISKTTYTDKNEIGSGLSVINGNTKTEVKLMVRMRF